MAFVHLHTHSEYSLLDGASRIPELVAHVKQLGMDSLAVTDHGNMHAAWSFYEQAKSQKIRPILGFEAYLAFGPRQAREKPSWRARRPTATSSCSPRIGSATRTSSGSPPSDTPRGSTAGRASTRTCLQRYSEGIVCLAACLSGEVALHLRQGKYEEAKRSAEWFARVFGRDGFWLEIQQHGIAEERVVTEGMLRLGQELGLGVVATNDAHYLRREDAESHDVLLAIGTGSDLDDPKRFRFTGEESYVKSETEMAALFPDQPGDPGQHADGRRTSASSISRRSTSCPGFPRPAELRQRRSAAGGPGPRGARRVATARRCRPRSPSGSPTSSGSSTRPATPATSSSSRTSSPRRASAGSRWAPAAAPQPARSWPTRSGSPTSARSSSTCCSSGSSIPSACRCPTSTWISASSAGARSSSTCASATGAPASGRSSPSAR